MSRRQWERLLGTLNFAAEVVPLGRLRHRRLVREVNAAIGVHSRDHLGQVARFLSDLLLPWLDPTPLSMGLLDALFSVPEGRYGCFGAGMGCTSHLEDIRRTEDWRTT